LPQHPKFNSVVQYLAPPPAKKNTANTRVAGSRVLTSAEGYVILWGKEEKKRKEKEEKEKKEQERIQKKKEKAKLAKKKAEEKARKVSHQKKQQKRKRTGTLEASESSSAFRNSTTEEETLISEDTVPPISEHDAIQAAVTPEQQDQEYECCKCFGTFEDDIALGNQA